MDLGLTGKKVLITGASKGIGAKIAYRFLEEGADVILVSRGSDSLTKTCEDLKNTFGNDRVVSKICDCTNENSLMGLKHDLDNTNNDLDILINNIGDGRSVSDALPDSEQWSKTWSNNFESALLTTRTFLPKIQKTKGCILFISSITAMEAFGAPVDYSTAKSAVTALSKNMARKLATEVRVNVLAPGNVYFPGGSWDEKMKQNSEAVHSIIKATVPMNRFGTPEEIADSAVFLCSERAKFITGTVLVVDGGQTVGVF